MADDIVFTIPESIADAGASFSDKALLVLDIFYDLNNFSQTLRDSLPKGNSLLALDTFWSKWSTQLLNMASEIESIAVLLGNAAVAYVIIDESIAEAFNGQPIPPSQQLNQFIKKIQDNNTVFTSIYNNDKQSLPNFQDEINQDKQDAKDEAEKEAASKQIFDQSVTWTASDL